MFQNMELFSELIQCGGIYTWCIMPMLICCRATAGAGFSGAFEMFRREKKMLDYSAGTTPITLGTAIGADMGSCL